MTASAYVDACGFIPVSNGTGDFVVSSNVTGYQTPALAGAVNTAVYSYRAESSDKTQWEIGFGAYTVSTTTLARTTVTASSTGSKVSFTLAPNVYITAATADLQNASLLTSGTLPVARLSPVLGTVTNSLGADVLLNNTGLYFDGPSCAQGTSGTWLAVGVITVTDTAVGGSFFNAKLWDGTNVISSGRGSTSAANYYQTIHLSGILAAPLANIRISCNDVSATTGKMLFNVSANSKDCTLTVIRIA